MSKKLPKKTIAIALAFLTILLGIAVVYKIFLAKSDKQASLSPLPGEKKDEEPEFQVDLEEWSDPAGFAFLYPSDLQVSSVEEDEVNYAHLKLTKEDSKGRVEIICGDSQFANLDDWQESDEEAKEGNALETEIASMSAKKVALSNDKEIAALIDADQVIYRLVKEGEGEKYWSRVFRAILSTFKLIPLEGESEADFQQWLGDFDLSGADIVEPVEVIE